MKTEKLKLNFVEGRMGITFYTPPSLASTLIIHHYPLLVNRYNTKGMSPLHVLSRMPQVFRSGYFRFIDSIIHFCINIDELELMTYETEGKGDLKLKLGWNLPENYQALAEFLELLWNGTRKIRDYIKERHFGNQKDKSKVCLGIREGRTPLTTAQATNVNPEESPDHQSYRQNDPENPPIKDTTNVNQDKMSQDTTNVNQDKMSQATTNVNQDEISQDTTNLNQDEMSQATTNVNQDEISQAEWKRNNKWFPANYTVFIQFLKCLMRIVLIVLAIGLPRIKKTEERKRQHARGVQIMKLLIAKEERYKIYESTGEGPEYWGFYLYDGDLAPPTKPPLIVEDDNIKDEDQSKTAATDEKKKDDHKSELSKPTKETPLLVASRMGIVEMVNIILEKHPIAIQDTDSEEKNSLLLAVEHRQADVYNWLIQEKYPPYVYYQVDKHGNNAMHLAAMFQNFEVWRIPGSALQLQGERKWYKYVKNTLPTHTYVPYNNKGQTPRDIFIETHVNLRKDGTEWLIKTANSYSFVATLITTVAFATAATIPGGPDDSGHPQLQNQPAFEVFCISSLVSLCFSVMALVFFLAILTSQCEHKDFETDLPRKLLIALTSLFVSISAILVSFCAAHFFLLGDKFKKVAFLIYGATCIPVVFLAFNQLPLYFDLICSSQELPIRSYKGYKKFFTNSSVASSSDQKKADKEKDG